MAGDSSKPCGCSHLADLARRILGSIGGDLVLDTNDVERLRTLAGKNTDPQPGGQVKVSYKDRPTELHPADSWTPDPAIATQITKVELL